MRIASSRASATTADLLDALPPRQAQLALPLLRRSPELKSYGVVDIARATLVYGQSPFLSLGLLKPLHLSVRVGEFSYSSGHHRGVGPRLAGQLMRR
jgi:hypothetical protein